ncbi:hypothetical protein D9758_005695 [Tetrapyrgos nigripes]|uniref:RNA-binding S4 domain-containing protein n=1 Tax=Tetrapyrgos nigripes TaxID=182062 RepID=A0A8H5GK90_9AGAR|nr:hypothetical protein D9758_005695 [Tetrapyrgos nigripes]
MRDRTVYNAARALPRMSWDPKNLFNLFQRTHRSGSRRGEIVFTRSSETLFQQRWRSKAMVRAYHGDYIPEKMFKRWYLPDNLPDVRPKSAINPSGILKDDAALLEEYAKRKTMETDYEKLQKRQGMAPVGSLMFAEVERRIDTVVFRACFAHSIYEARRLVVHGDVLLNGKKHADPNTRLAPGDMISVKPDAIRFLRPPREYFQDSVNEAHPEMKKLTPFNLPHYASPWIFIPAYIEPNFATCSAVYVRHPTARPGYSEIPTPYEADGEVVRFAWEWYSKRRPRVRSQSKLARMPLDRAYNPEEMALERSRARERKAAKRRTAVQSGMIF